MTKTKKIIGVTLLVILYFVILAIGFFAIYTYKTNSQNVEKNMTITSQSPSTTASAPAGFKTYENKDKTLKFNYPPTFDVQEKSYGFGVNTMELRSENNTDASDMPDVQILTLPKSIAKMIGQDFDAYYQMKPNESKSITSELQGEKEEQLFTKIKNREINGMRAVEYTSIPIPNPENYEAELGVFIENGDAITMFVTGESQKEDLENIIRTYSSR